MRTAGSGERANPGIYFLAAEAAAFTAGAALTAGLLFFFTAAAALGAVLPAVTADTLAAGVLDTAATAGAAAFGAEAGAFTAGVAAKAPAATVAAIRAMIFFMMQSWESCTFDIGGETKFTAGIRPWTGFGALQQMTTETEATGTGIGGRLSVVSKLSP